ncbi:MAG: sigma-70 family RNA polymerase sigma factor [Proteobacteria bacterium]|nr:sigma-70 family RNA polymerase sigma factor [Pseudomonadota bacterium]
MGGAVLDEALIRLADGDRSAFDTVYDQAWPRIVSLTRRLLPDDRAEDAAQTALLKVFEHASEYDPDKGRALPWILGIAGWECRTARKQLARRQEEPQVETPVVDDPTDRIVQAELLAALEDAMGQLRPDDVETLRAAAGLIERPDIPGATFRKRVQRSMDRLRAAWRKSHG